MVTNLLNTRLDAQYIFRKRRVFHHPAAIFTLRFKVNGWGGGRLFFRDFWGPPAVYFDPPVYKFLEFLEELPTEVLKYIIDS